MSKTLVDVLFLKIIKFEEVENLMWYMRYVKNDCLDSKNPKLCNYRNTVMLKI